MFNENFIRCECNSPYFTKEERFVLSKDTEEGEVETQKRLVQFFCSQCGREASQVYEEEDIHLYDNPL